MTQNKWRNILEKEEKEFVNSEIRMEKLTQEYYEKTNKRASINMPVFQENIKKLNEVLKDYYLSFGSPITQNQHTTLVKALLGVDPELIKKENTQPIMMASSSLEPMYDNKGEVNDDNIMIMASVGFEDFKY